jgi:glycosyltransferase involved in cell wall biosynthesis
MSSPAISVVMSVYNGEAFLAEAVDSILAQTLTDFEFVIIDDGSTDGTPRILSDYTKRDARVRVFTQPNRGRAESLNSGIDRARAPLIARMDADDISLPDRLEQQFRFMKAHPEVGLLGGAADLVTLGRQRIGTHRPPLEDSEIRRALLHWNVFFHPTLIIRQNIVKEAGGYRKALLDADDYDLILRIAERTQVANAEPVVLLYRVHPNQVSVRGMRRQIECVLAARAAACLRRCGLTDPLSDAACVTPELLQYLGVSREEVRRFEFSYGQYLMRLLANADPDSALAILKGLLVVCNSTPNERALAADSLMLAASIQYRRGRFRAALGYVSRGIMVEPTVVVRHLKMAIARRAHALPQ